MTGELELDELVDELHAVDTLLLLVILLVMASISADCKVSLKTFGGVGEELCESLELGLFEFD